MKELEGVGCAGLDTRKGGGEILVAEGPVGGGRIIKRRKNE